MERFCIAFCRHYIYSTWTFPVVLFIAKYSSWASNGLCLSSLDCTGGRRIICNRSLESFLEDRRSWLGVKHGWFLRMVDCRLGLFIADGRRGTVSTWSNDGLMFSLGAADIFNLMFWILSYVINLCYMYCPVLCLYVVMSVLVICTFWWWWSVTFWVRGLVLQ